MTAANDSMTAANSAEFSPSFAEFCAAAQTHTVVPVWKEMLGDLETPVAAFRKLVGDAPGFLLESVEHGGRWGRFSFIGRDPRVTIVSRRGPDGAAVLRIDGVLPNTIDTEHGVLAAIEGLLEHLRSASHPDLPPLIGGIVGYLGYDVIREVERLPGIGTDDSGLPDAVLDVVGSIAAFDHWRQRVYLVDNVIVGPTHDESDLSVSYAAACDRITAMAEDLGRPLGYTLGVPPDQKAELPEVRCSMQPGAYRDAVAVAKQHIVDGDIFQVVLSQRFDFELGADPFDVYRVLRLVNPSPYMYFLRHREVTIVGSSPEPMVQLVGDRVVSRPIAGTRRRGATEADDRRLAAELIEHPKEVAEHVMLVDLARNDIGRVSEFGTCTVEELMTLERYSHVMHLTSQVAGRVRAGVGPIDVLRATLPAGTVSGAPKVRAMEIIDALEPVRRGPYAGVVGYFDFSGNLDTAITIRTMYVRPDGIASVQAGAGIVADSDPQAEDEECAHKARALLAAVPAARLMSEMNQVSTLPA